jgi:DUF4097 and DUF4098 domain-containing protein YvlB
MGVKLFGQSRNTVFEGPTLREYSLQADGLRPRRDSLLIEMARPTVVIFTPVLFMAVKYGRPVMIKLRSLVVLLVGVLALGGCDLSINSSIDVPDGESRSGFLATVNGDVSIGNDCMIEGKSTSVNGSIKIGDRSNVGDLSTVNGSIRIGEGVSIEGDVESVNGSVEFGAGSEVSGKVGTVNGDIELNRTIVQADLRTVNGDIELRDNSIVKGNVVIKGKKDVSERERSIEIEVTGGSTIEGDVVVERSVDVRLILRDGGKVLGKVDGAEVIDN